MGEIYKNVNANILTCSKTKIKGNCCSYQGVFDVTKAKKDGKTYRVHDFEVVLQLSILFYGDNDKDIVEFNKEYEGMLAIRHNDSDRCVIISNFDICFSKDNTFFDGRRNLCIIIRRTKVKGLKIPLGLGIYSIEFLMREKNRETEWDSQTVASLLIC